MSTDHANANPESTAKLPDIDRRLTVLGIRLQQQERIIQSLKPGAGRLEALSVLADLLRSQHQLMCQRDLERGTPQPSIFTAPNSTS